MKLTIEIELPEDYAVAYDWYTGMKPKMHERMRADLEREAQFRTEQYLRNIVTFHQMRPR